MINGKNARDSELTKLAITNEQKPYDQASLAYLYNEVGK